MSAHNFLPTFHVDRQTLDREMLRFTLELYNNPLISRKVVDLIIERFDSLISNSVVPFLQSQMETKMKHLLNDEVYCKLQFILHDCKNLFEKMSTEDKRLRLYEQHFYINPELFEIGKEIKFVCGENTIVKEKAVYAAHIPLSKTLSAVFSNPALFTQMQKYYKQLLEDKSTLSNFVQGELWQNKYMNIFKNSNHSVFPIFLYYDEFEAGNPLASHAGEEKLGGVYASLACLPPHLVGKMDNVFLSTLFQAKYLKKFKNADVFKKVIEDVNFLSDKGIIINNNGVEEKVYFVCGLILGDNLGINCICGFSESFTANHYCRFCYAPKNVCEKLATENESLLRTVQSYEIDLIMNKFEITGLKERCIFNGMKYFHIEENISADVMHDLPEGAILYDIENILKSLIDDNIVSVEVVNNRIETFPFNDVEKPNKPRPIFFTISKKGGREIKMRQSAAESLCLARYLGLMIGDLVSSDNKYWKLYQRLRQLIGILYRPNLTRAQILNLKEVIQEHNLLFIELYGKLKPKMHLLTHYVRIMLLNGPVIHFSTYKFERENRKLKEVAIGTTSSVNLPFTIAMRE